MRINNQTIQCCNIRWWNEIFVLYRRHSNEFTLSNKTTLFMERQLIQRRVSRYVNTQDVCMSCYWNGGVILPLNPGFVEFAIWRGGVQKIIDSLPRIDVSALIGGCNLFRCLGRVSFGKRRIAVTWMNLLLLSPSCARRKATLDLVEK